jgi:pimeloyl-ACP methyl ester carboxylesterase
MARARATARACGRRYSDAFLAHIDTVDMARDMDTIRTALGATQINYLGYSYGTYLGEVYGQLYPSRLRRMILDSVVDPTTTGYQASFGQDKAFQVRLAELLRWIAGRDRRYHLGSSGALVGRRWADIRRRLAQRPAGGRVGPSELDEATIEALYSTTSWSGLAQALAAYERGHDQPLIATGKILSGASNPAMLAVSCRDTAWPRRWSRWNRDARRVFAHAPLTTWTNTWEGAPCAFWPVPGGPAINITGRGVPPVLLLQSRHDPATPVAGALHVKALYGSSDRIVLEAGGNHGQYLFNGNDCMDRYGNAYLLNGTLPAPGANCAGTTRYAAGDASAGLVAREADRRG